MSTASSHASDPGRNARLDVSSVPRRSRLHLLGIGQVGRALLGLLGESDPLVVAATDTSGTVHDPAGLDLRDVARWKAEGRPLATHRRALSAVVSTLDALRLVGAEVVVDATATRFDRPEWADALDALVVRPGRKLVLAAKDAPARNAYRWLRPGAESSVGINATLGGAGAALGEDIAELRDSCVDVALAGNGSTTVILQVMEAGGSFEEGAAEAGRRGLLEADAELDFRGADAAVKLAVVAQALWGRSVPPADIPSEDIRHLDASVVRARALSGRTTRLVGRGRADGTLSVGYEELAVGDPLAVPPDRAVYAYRSHAGALRVHLGAGMGPQETARALLADIRRIGGQGSVAGARRSARFDAGPRTGLVHLPASFRLASGERLHPAQVAFEASGPEDAPVTVVLGAPGAGARPTGAGDGTGRADGRQGSARTTDTERIRTVYVGPLGGVGGSSGPATSAHWPDGASVTPDDQARAVRAVLDALGVARADAVVAGPGAEEVEKVMRAADDRPHLTWSRARTGS